MPRASLQSLGFSLRLGGLSLGLAALIALPASCGLDAEGEQFTGGLSSNPSGGGGGGGVGGGGGSGGGSVCAPNEQTSCYSGPAGTEMMGACTPGITTCNAEGSDWGPCEGEVVPGTESCATAVDDDCDGMVNEGGEGCACTPNVTTQPCYSGPMGTEMNMPCKAGTQTCNATGDGFGPCVGEVKPEAEDCSTPTDENCNAAEKPMADPPVADVAAGCVCVPGSPKDCYTGPAMTQGVGICQGGTQTCNADGYGYGSCNGETLPADENCATKGTDENCDGNAMELCPGETHWSKRAGNSGAAEAYSVATDASGNVIIVGGFDGAVDFGGGSLASAGNDDIFIAKFGPTGTHAWSKRFGGGGNDIATSVAVTSAGEIVIVGTFDTTPTIDLGGGAKMNLGSTDGFALKLDESGNHIWSQVLGAASQQQATSVAVAPAGDIYVCGSFQGTPDFGTGTNLVNGGGNDYFLLKLGGGNGSTMWAKGFGDGANQQTCSVAADSANNAILAVALTGMVNFGGMVLAANQTDAAVAKFTPAGAHSWSKKFGEGGFQDAQGVAVDSEDRILVTGEAGGSADYGGGMLTASGQDVLVLRLNADGSYSFAQLIGGANDQAGVDVAAGDMDSIVLVGNFSTSIDYGGPGAPPTGNNAPEGFALQVTSAGAYIWGRPFAGAGTQQPESVAVDNMGNVVMTGYFTTSIDFGGGINVLAGQGGNDVFVAKLQK